MNDRSTTLVTNKKKMMTTKKKTTSKMMMLPAKGFMCQNTTPPAAPLFLCGANDLPRSSAIVPAASTRGRLLLLRDRNADPSTVKYSRLKQEKVEGAAVEPRKLKKKCKEDVDHGGKPIRRDCPISPRRYSFQVVVMRVALHCQGCAGQVKRHLSKMEGVTSFSIDLETQRVTVMGHVSPGVVLQSISKVKRAELWPTSPSPSSPSPSSAIM